MSYNIAIDGPAGAGKSTIAKIIAKNLNFIYVDTGAMFRAMAVFCLENGVDVQDEKKTAEAVKDVDVKIEYVEGAQQIILNGENVTGRLRTEEVGNTASVIAVYPEIREKLLNLQRKMAAETDLVMDGRDIGSFVLPNATLKIYLTASSRTRAQRRYDELVAKGETPDIDAIEADIIERDYRDMHRETAPLVQAEDAILVDSSDMTIEEVTETINNLFNEKVK